MVSKYTFTTHRLAELTELRRFNFTTSEIYDQYHRLDFLMCMRHQGTSLHRRWMAGPCLHSPLWLTLSDYFPLRPVGAQCLEVINRNPEP